MTNRSLPPSRRIVWAGQQPGGRPQATLAFRPQERPYPLTCSGCTRASSTCEHTSGSLVGSSALLLNSLFPFPWEGTAFDRGSNEREHRGERSQLLAVVLSRPFSLRSPLPRFIFSQIGRRFWEFSADWVYRSLFLMEQLVNFIIRPPRYEILDFLIVFLLCTFCFLSPHLLIFFLMFDSLYESVRIAQCMNRLWYPCLPILGMAYFHDCGVGLF